MTLMRSTSFLKDYLITEQKITVPIFFKIVRQSIQKKILVKAAVFPQFPALLNTLVNAEDKR
jgi:hypothetical protein